MGIEIFKTVGEFVERMPKAIGFKCNKLMGEIDDEEASDNDSQQSASSNAAKRASRIGKAAPSPRMKNTCSLFRYGHDGNKDNLQIPLLVESHSLRDATDWKV